MGKLDPRLMYVLGYEGTPTAREASRIIGVDKGAAISASQRQVNGNETAGLLMSTDGQDIVRHSHSPTILGPIVESLELAAERCNDLTPVVYERLFREYPETRVMFRTEGSNFVKGSMLELALDAILDFAGERKAAHRMIFCEVQSHEAYGTPRKLFGVFFTVIADCVRELLGKDWSPAIEAAWTRLLADLDAYVNDAMRAAFGTS